MKVAPPPKMTTTEWANRYRFLSEKAAARPGKYNSDLTPWIKFIHEALDDPRVYKLVCMKSAQVAWTDGVINNYIARRIDIDPCPMIAMFAKQEAAKEYMEEKFEPMVEVTPRLADKVDISKSRKANNRKTFKNFSGGFLKLVGSNSTSNVKSTPAPVVIIEEPDDCSQNVGDQGDSIKLLEERTKTYHRRKIIFGGTPSVKGVSAVEDGYDESDQRKFYVPCHDCGEAHVLSWDNVSWIEEEDASVVHIIYGKHKPETARYVCPHCGSAWDDNQKNRNVRNLYPEAHAEFHGVAGFYINELYSPFPGSRLKRLVERYLAAKKELDQGDDTSMIVFINSAIGLPYEYQSDAPEVQLLQDRALDYPEKHIPDGGLILTAGIDVQHDRLAIVIRAWGREEESWLVYWGEIHGTITDRTDPVWEELDKLLFSPFQHVNGRAVGLQAASFDSSDGATNDAIYAYIRSRTKKTQCVLMAIKGDSHDNGTREIYSKPKESIDLKSKGTKATKYGLRPFLVGTQKAKDLIASRIKLEGDGAGRFHFYQTVRADYFEQITSEIKVPHRTIRNRKVWQCKSGVRNEGLDCEVYALHASRRMRVHLLKPAQWDDIENRLIQSDLFDEVVKPKKQKRAANKKTSTKRKTGGGFVSRYKN